MEPGLAEDFESFALARIPRLLGFAYALTGNRTDAEDLVQEALARVGTRWARVQRRGSPEPYVRRTITNLHISWWRRHRREVLKADPPDPGATPAPTDGAIWQQVKDLPARQSAVIALRYYEDLTEVETARVLGCSVGTVKSQAAKALRKLRGALDESCWQE